MPLDREKFIKVMMLTTSSSDGEALNALRLANRMLADNRINWSEKLSGETSSQCGSCDMHLRVSRSLRGGLEAAQDREWQLRKRVDVLENDLQQAKKRIEELSRGAASTREAEVAEASPEEIEEMIELCLDEVGEPARNFIVSLQEYFEKNHRLSPKQIAALKRFYANAC